MIIKEDKGRCEILDEIEFFCGIYDGNTKRYVSKLFYEINLSTNRVFIDVLKTKKKHRKKGYASMLLKYFCEKYKNSELYLEVHPDVKWFVDRVDTRMLLCNLYKKFGFVLHPKRGFPHMIKYPILPKGYQYE